MEKLLEKAPCGFLTFLDDGRILQVNERLKTMLEYDGVPGLEGKSIDVILTVSSRIFYNTHFFPLIRMHGKADEIFLSLSSRTGKIVPVLANALRTTENDTYVNQCVLMPVYQRKKYEEEILNAKRLAEEALKKNESLTRLIGQLETRTQELDKQNSKLQAINLDLHQFNKIISHDLQEPIRKIQLFSDMMTRQLKNNSSDKGTSILKKIISATERLRRLTAELEQYIKVGTEEPYARVDLNDALDAARRKAADDRKFNNFNVFSDSLPVVEGYPGQLELLFYHLFRNAIECRDQQKTLSIRITSAILHENVYRTTEEKYRYTEHVRIQFEDNGVGFDNQYNKYVFNALSKINPQTEGLGMGLSLCKKIIDNHMGSIRVNSETGKGTSFTILLPTKQLVLV